MVDTTKSSEWFRMAMIDYNSAKILFEYEGDYGVICFHLQQCVEKYLKGYLITQTGLLQNGHNLKVLCKTCKKYNNGFGQFVKDVTFLGGFYIEARYPQEDPLESDEEETKECFKIADNVIKFIDGLLGR